MVQHDKRLARNRSAQTGARSRAGLAGNDTVLSLGDVKSRPRCNMGNRAGHHAITRIAPAVGAVQMSGSRPRCLAGKVYWLARSATRRATLRSQTADRGACGIANRGFGVAQDLDPVKAGGVCGKGRAQGGAKGHP